MTDDVKSHVSSRVGHRSRVRRYLLSLLASSLVAVIFVPEAHAIRPPAPTSTPRKRLRELKSALGAHRAALRDLNNKERNLIITVSAFDRDLGRLSDAHDVARKKLRELNLKLEPLMQSLRLAEEKLARSQARLQKRLRALYVLSRGGAARHLLGAQSFSDLALRRRLLEDMAKTDARLVRTHNTRVNDVNERRRAIQSRVREAKEIESEIAEEEEILATTRKERASAMLRIENEKELGVKAVKDIVKQQRAVERELRSKLPKFIRPRQGKGILAKGILRPLRGTFIRGFGTWRDKVSRAKVTSNGVHIRAALGTPVAAAANGRVVFEGWQKGLGRIVIVDHEEGHHTIYGHLSRALARRGERVVRGQTIGFVGDSASLEGPKLYLELREGGRPKNPAAYLRAQ